MENPTLVSVEDGCGSGCGSGDGSGDGYGDGYGSGDGYGDGYGYGYGYGSGYGYGDGYGSGYGYGSGDGYGDGYGSGYGYGDGYGDGYGSGYGSGDGYGDGYGSGYGSGDGYGDGSGDGYWVAVFETHYSTLPRVRELCSQDPTIAFAYWRSDRSGRACNGGNSKESARPGLIEQISGPLEICTRRALHATVEPTSYKGDRLWVVALSGEIQISGNKVGALKREIICEVTERKAA
jgi:hypothetical protein